ncbi:MAG: helix-turn-helix domain-containing protein [bacterium]
MSYEVEKRAFIIRGFLKGRFSKQEAAQLLGKSIRTVERYTKRFLNDGLGSLRDSRTGNNRKLSFKNELEIVRVKKEGPWRSARKIRDIIGLKVHPNTVWRVEVKHGASRLNYGRVKPITRFVAPNPNDLWQADIMGRIAFPKLGVMYLIANIMPKLWELILLMPEEPRPKGSIERFWRFVQRDFARENLAVSSVEELNKKFFKWQEWFN